jgi:hypothetical protein
MFRILSVGNDRMLLESRAALLRYAGAEVDAADVQAARSTAMFRRYDLPICANARCRRTQRDMPLSMP